ncbi:OmpP1/FadL family transporter [Flexibacterium corallicola]|uniref:OmpP1/FadL family transporter n=1 Tax=Flexibacterium corallicola TaxID=3037259 RepID=UPI00286F754F|nr:OmpP1/FadL family transporter [Pseudovibrio sp. M1P-2-3]
MLKTSNILFGISGLLLVVGSQQAQGGAFALREQSAFYQGLSFAGYGVQSESLSSMFWNPATIVGREGMQGESVNTGVFPRADIDTDYAAYDTPENGFVPLNNIPGAAAGSAGDVGENAWLGSSYGTYQVNDRIFLGLSVTAPFGLATKPNSEWAGQIYARSSRVLSVNATPMIGTAITDYLSVGVGLQVQYFQVRLKSAFPPGGEGVLERFVGLEGIRADAGTAELEGEDHNLGFGGTIGVLINPMENLQIGVGYRSPIRHELKGHLKKPAFSFFGMEVPAERTPITSTLTLPEQINASFQYDFLENARIMGTFEWTNWSRFSSFKVYNRVTGEEETELSFFYNDGYYLSIGGEYDYNGQFTFRAGVGYEWSPIDDANRSPRLPDTDRVWLSAGLSYNYKDWLSADIGYSHLFAVGDDKININPDSFQYEGVWFEGNVDGAADIISGSIRIKY